MEIKEIHCKRFHSWQLISPHKLRTKLQVFFLFRAVQEAQSSHGNHRHPQLYTAPRKYLCVHPAESTGSDLHLHFMVSGGRKVLLGQIYSCSVRQWMCPKGFLQLLKEILHFWDCFVGKTGRFFNEKRFTTPIIIICTCTLLLLLLLLLLAIALSLYNYNHINNNIN